jgi:hypothetical protein
VFISADYKPWAVSKTQSLKPANDYAPNANPFEGRTTNQADYTEKSAERAKGFRPNEDPFRSEASLDGTTTTMADYRPWEASKTQSLKPRQSRHTNDGPFGVRHIPVHVLIMEVIVGWHVEPANDIGN